MPAAHPAEPSHGADGHADAEASAVATFAAGDYVGRSCYPVDVMMSTDFVPLETLYH